MKNVVWLCAASILTISCNNFSADEIAENKDSFADTIQTIDNQFCFESQNGKDAVLLTYDLVGNDVSGDLGYAIQGKDRNEGTVRGEWLGDTLLLDYLFQSEGSLSSRQVIFLKQDSLLLEGYGASDEKDGKWQFTNRADVKFGGGITLKRVGCRNELPAAQNAVAAAVKKDTSSQGSEVLFMFRWELKELNGTKINEDKRALTYLLFSPGQVSQVSGRGGCNRLTGTFELSGTREFKFGAIASTKMACPEMEQETVFLKALAEVNQWKAIDNELFLQKDGTNLAVFQSVTNK